MPESSKTYTFDRVFRLALAGVVIWGIIQIAAYLSDVLIPFAVAFLMAYLLNPLVNRVQRKISNRVAAVSITLVGVVVFCVFCLWLIIPFILKEVQGMGHLLKEFTQNTRLAEKAAHYLPEGEWSEIKAEIESKLKAHDVDIENLPDLLKQKGVWKLAWDGVHKITPYIWRFVSGTTGILFGFLGIFVILLYLFFLLIDYQEVKEEWADLLPPAYKAHILGFIKEFDAAMHRHFRAQAMVAVIVGLLFAVGFSLIGLPMGIFLGVFIGMLNMVPYLQIVGLFPAAILAVMKSLESNGSVGISLGLTLAVFLIVQVIQDGVLTPKIMGKSSGLKPVMILLSVSVWGKLLGFFGLVIALPMTCLCLAYYKRLLSLQTQDPKTET